MSDYNHSAPEAGEPGEHNPVEAEAQPSDRLAELVILEERYAALPAALEEQMVRLEEIEAGLPLQVRDHITAATADYGNQEVLEAPLYQYLADQPNVPSEFTDALEDLFQLEQQQADTEHELAGYAAEKREQISAEAETLAARINYDAAADKLLQLLGKQAKAEQSILSSLSTGKGMDMRRLPKKERPHLRGKPELTTDDIRVALNVVVGIDRFLEHDGSDLTYAELCHVKQILDARAASLEGAGFLFDEPVGHLAVEADLPETDEYRSTLAETEMIRFGTNLYQARTLLMRYGLKPDNWGELSDSGSVVARTEQVFEWKQDRPHSLERLQTASGLISDDRVTAALQLNLQRLLKSIPPERLELSTNSEVYKEATKCAREIDVEQALEKLDVSGLEGLPFAIDEAELKAYIGRYVPPIAIADVTKFEVRDLTEEEESSDIHAASYIPGSKHGEGIVVVSRKYLQRIYDSATKKEYQYLNKEELERMVAEELRLTFFEFTLHEYGHALHYNVDAAAMKRWEEDIDADDTAVTPYVTKSRQEDETTGRREDFAETCRYFIARPGELMIGSQDRLSAMTELYRDYFPGFDDVLREELASTVKSSLYLERMRGRSIEDMRRNWFPHEYQDAAPDDSRA